MSYLVATIDSNHKPKHIFGSTANYEYAKTKAKAFAERYNRVIGIFHYNEDKFYGLFESYGKD